MADQQEMNFALAVLQIKAQRERDKLARAQEQETMQRERELFSLQKQKMQLELEKMQRTAENLEAQRAGLAELTTSYLQYQAAKDKDQMTGGGSVTSTYQLDEKGRQVLDEEGRPKRGPARTMTAKGESLAEKRKREFQATYLKVAQTSPEAVALYAQGFKDFDSTLVPLGMGVAPAGPSLDAQKKSMDLYFDGLKIVEKDLAPETPEQVRKRGEGFIRSTQDNAAALASSIHQKVSLLGLGSELDTDVRTAAQAVADGARSTAAGTPTMDNLVIDLQNKLVSFNANAAKVLPAGSQNGQVLAQLRTDLDNYRRVVSTMGAQRQQTEDEAVTVTRKLEYGNILYGKAVAKGADNFTAARSASREAQEVFVVAAQIEKELNLNQVIVDARKADSSDDVMNAAIDVIKSKVATRFGTDSTKQAELISDLLSTKLRLAQAAAIQTQLFAAPTQSSPKPTTTTVPRTGGPSRGGPPARGWKQ